MGRSLFFPNALATSKKGPEYRFIAIREKLEQQLSIPETETVQYQLPFPTMEMGPGEAKRPYKLTALVTNLDRPGDDVIWWLRKRCGKSEEVHSILKGELAGGHMPQGYLVRMQPGGAYLSCHLIFMSCSRLMDWAEAL